jgi:hypothetical protein
MSLESARRASDVRLAESRLALSVCSTSAGSLTVRRPARTEHAPGPLKIEVVALYGRQVLLYRSALPKLRHHTARIGAVIAFASPQRRDEKAIGVLVERPKGSAEHAWHVCHGRRPNLTLHRKEMLDVRFMHLAGQCARTRQRELRQPATHAHPAGPLLETARRLVCPSRVHAADSHGQ